MCAELRTVLALLDSGRQPLIDYEFARRLPSNLLDVLESKSVLQRAEPESRIYCRECGRYEHVVLVADRRFGSTALVQCAAVGSYAISSDHLARWRVSPIGAIRMASEGLGIERPPSELIGDRVWLLGKTGIGGASRNVYFIRGFPWPDIAAVLGRIRITPGSLIFVPARIPSQRGAIVSRQVVIPLSMVVSWRHDKLVFDREYVTSQLTRQRAGAPRKQNPSPKRGPRVALIGQLKEELIQHLRAARDYAQDTRERTGTPALLPRPTKELLARKLRVHRSTVTRAFADASASELRMLWDLAADLDGILGRTHDCA